MSPSSAFIPFKRRKVEGTRLETTTPLNNALLRPIFHVLKAAVLKHAACTGFGVTSKLDIYQKLLKFKKNLGSRQDFFMVTLDLDKCFDNIDARRLLDMTVSLLTEVNTSPTSTLHRYSITQYVKSKDALSSRTHRIVTDGKLLHFDEVCKVLAQHLRGAILSDGVLTSSISEEGALSVLRRLYFHHVVQMPNSAGGHSKCRQLMGIPQGSVLSPLLCNLYYGSIENDAFLAKESGDWERFRATTLVMRQMDDYLVLSTDKNELSKLPHMRPSTSCISVYSIAYFVGNFVQSLCVLLKTFGGGINLKKSSSNVELALDIDGKRFVLPPNAHETLSWCGLSIDCRSVEVSVIIVHGAYTV